MRLRPLQTVYGVSKLKVTIAEYKKVGLKFLVMLGVLLNDRINTIILISKTSNDKFINPNKFGNSKIYTITREQI